MHAGNAQHGQCAECGVHDKVCVCVLYCHVCTAGGDEVAEDRVYNYLLDQLRAATTLLVQTEQEVGTCFSFLKPLVLCLAVAAPCMLRLVSKLPPHAQRKRVPL